MIKTVGKVLNNLIYSRWAQIMSWIVAALHFVMWNEHICAPSTLWPNFASLTCHFCLTFWFFDVHCTFTLYSSWRLFFFPFKFIIIFFGYTKLLVKSATSFLTFLLNLHARRCPFYPWAALPFGMVCQLPHQIISPFFHILELNNYIYNLSRLHITIYLLAKWFMLYGWLASPVFSSRRVVVSIFFKLLILKRV